MSDSAEHRAVVELTDGEASAIETAAAWVKDSLADLGDAYLELVDAQERLKQAEERAEELRAHAYRAQRQHDKVLQSIAQLHSLPAGKWTYNRQDKSLVKENAANGKTARRPDSEDEGDVRSEA